MSSTHIVLLLLLTFDRHLFKWFDIGIDHDTGCAGVVCAATPGTVEPAVARPAPAVWGAVCFRSSSERAVTDVRDGPLGWTFETNGTDSWRRLLQKSVRAGRGSRPWTAGRDGPPERTFETNGTDSCRRLLQKFVRAGRGRPAVTGRRDWLLKQTARIPGTDCCRSPSERAVGAGRPWTAGRDGPPERTFETNGTDSCRRLLQKFVRAGRGRPAVTGRRDWLLKQTARIPGADCCRSSSERAVDGRPWRAAGIDFWNKRHGFLAPIVAEVRQSGPWQPAVDGRPWRAAGDWLLKQTARIPVADCCRSSSERAVDGRPWRAAGDWLLKQTARIPGADCFKSLSDRAVVAGRRRLAVTGIHLPDLDHTRETPFQHNLHIKQCLRHYVQEAIFTWMTEFETIVGM